MTPPPPHPLPVQTSPKFQTTCLVQIILCTHMILFTDNFQSDLNISRRQPVYSIQRAIAAQRAAGLQTQMQ